MVVGFLDALAGILMVFGGKQTSGTLQTLLFQAVIPLTMILAKFLLKEKYKPMQYIGALTVLLGVGVSFYPTLADQDGSIIFSGVYFCATIPTACSAIYKEYSLKRKVFFLKLLMCSL